MSPSHRTTPSYSPRQKASASGLLSRSRANRSMTSRGTVGLTSRWKRSWRATSRARDRRVITGVVSETLTLATAAEVEELREETGATRPLPPLGEERRAGGFQSGRPAPRAGRLSPGPGRVPARLNAERAGRVAGPGG